MPKPQSVLVVCLGNICRSPAGESILAYLIEENPSLDVKVDSCGTGDWHLGSPPDSRMQRAAKARGLVMTSVSRGIRDADFEAFDYILAVDREIVRALELKVACSAHHSKIHLLSDFSVQYQGQNIPDPFYGECQDFERALDMLEDSCRGFVQYLLDY